MPSANPKLEKQASTEAFDPIRQAIIVIEHKIRNLEKRKGKLESYKDLQKGGGELNADQKQAVAKYDEVIQTLDITRDLLKSVQQIANDALKQQKKLARKEALERMQQDIGKVREVLLIQDTLMNMGADSIRDDFLAGANGAVKLTEADLKALDSLYNEVTITHRRDDSSMAPAIQQAQKIAEHFVAIIEGKQREFEVGLSYNKLKETITSITQCGYFDKAQESEVAEAEVVEVAAEVQVMEAPVLEQANDDFNSGDRHIPPADPTIPIPNYVQITTIPVVPGTASVSGQIPVVGQPLPPHPAAAIDSSYYSNAGSFVPPPQVQQQPPTQQQTQAPRINDVIGTPNFFFLQDSELDSPDMNAQAPIVTHIPPAVNAPIPTQTFTNQNFNTASVVPQAVMYQHQPPPPDMSHIPGFANPNPPPPIPMPPSHQQPNMPYSPQHPTGYQQQPQGLSQINQTQVYDQHQQESQIQATENKNDQNQGETASGEGELDQQNEPVDWGQMSEGAGDWNQPDQSQDSSQDQQQSSQQAWGDQQRSGYRGRGGRRGNSNGYSGRGRVAGSGGGGGYQQNGRSSTGGGQGSYYRNESSNYQQNGYHQRNNWNEGSGGTGGSGGYNSGFKRGTGGPRSGARGGERGSDRAGRGQFRGSQRGSSRGGYSNRGKPQTQQ